MQLEVISRYPRQPSGQAPLLFVHGSFSSAVVWAERFLPYFADAGYESHAVSLRGHGGSPGHEHLPWWRLSDYVDDVRRTVDKLGRPAVLIGHSMGGMVVQKFLETEPAVPAVVLMASVPPAGLWATSVSMFLSNPLLFQQICWMQLLGPRFAQRPLVRRALFSDDVPEDQARRYFGYWQDESQLVVADLMGWDPLRLDPEAVTAPVLVIGAEHDAFVSTLLVEHTSRYYGGEAVMFPMAHAMMLDAGWERVASHIADWLALSLRV